MADTTFYKRGDAYHDSTGNPAIIEKGNELTFTEHFNAGGGGSTPYTPPPYSTNEQLTGKKDIDGKDIYIKSFIINSLPNTRENGFNHGITNIHRMIKLSGSAQNSEKTSFFPLPYVAQQNFEGCIKLSMNATQISIWTGSDRSNLNGIITVEYTKTTPTRTSKKKG